MALLIKWAVRATANDLSLFGATAGSAFLSAHRVGGDHRTVGLVGCLLTHPATLGVGIILTALSLGVYRRLCRGESRYQNALLGIAIGVGASVGFVVGIGVVDFLLRFLPWCVVVALLGSKCVSRAKQYN